MNLFKIEPLCEKCQKRKRVFDSPGYWCSICWADWWFDGLKEDAETQEEIEWLEKERKEFLKEEVEQGYLRPEDIDENRFMN